MKQKKIGKKKLFDLLFLVNGVKDNMGRLTSSIIACFNSDNKPEIISKAWGWDYKNENPKYYPLDLSSSNLWSTYEGCYSITFSNEKGKLKCSSTIFDGSSFDGRRKEIKFKAEFILPSDFIFLLQEKIMYSLDSYIERKHDEYLLEQKAIWIDTLKKEILSSR